MKTRVQSERENYKNAALATRTEIHQVIDQLDADQLAQLANYLKRLIRGPLAPIYQIHQEAIATGVKDLADQHDYYLYGQNKHDA